VKRTALKRKPWRRALGDSELWAQFKFAVAQADDFTCVMRRGSPFTSPAMEDRYTGEIVIPARRPTASAVPCDGPLQACHVIPKSKLRDWGYGAETIYSVDAAFTACRRHHTRHDSYLERIPDSLIPERCREFAQAAERSRETA
jgi:HNH endonuclease